MAFQANAKTWQVVANQTLLTDTSAGIHTTRTLNKIKSILTSSFTAHPWTVPLCSNAGVVSAVNYGTTGTSDLWVIDNQVLTQSGGVITVPQDINGAAAGVRHSWIVLRNTSIATNFEICFDVLNSSGQCSMIVSPAAGFTGGSVTARPTATDEKSVLTTLLQTQINTTHQLHAWQSSDGQCNRIMCWTGGTHNNVWLQFDLAQNPVTNWTNPCVYAGLNTAAVSGQCTAFAVMAAVTTFNMRGLGPANFQGSATFEAYSTNTALPTAVAIGAATNAFDNSWPVMPMGLASNAAGNTGRIGNLYDMWHAPIGIPDGNTFPSSCTARTHVKLGGLILPWTGDSTMPLIA